ncbi:hypothetical protein [Microbispora sp. NPDC049633]|uniref:hypothetical protein n=1 Tax=Microbispora sp. NPDC049633 TaxID=3154355 RepID=UPI0034303484
MKKADIQPGTVYAYEGRYGIEPVVVISTALLVEDTIRGHRHTPGESKLYTRSLDSRPTRHTSSRASGYAAVKIDRKAVTEANVKRAAAVTLEQFLDLVSSNLGGGLTATILTTLPKLLGPYEEIRAQRDAEDAEAARIEQERQDRLEAEQAAIEDLSARSKALGGKYDIWPRYEISTYKPNLHTEDLARLVALAEAAHKVWEEMERASKDGALTPERESELAYDVWNRVNEINAQPSE